MTDFIEQQFQKLYKYLGDRYYMDYKGQELADNLQNAISAVFSLIGIIVGYYYQKLSYSVYICLFGTFLCLLFCIFPINFLYQRNPIKWLKPKNKDEWVSFSEMNLFWPIQKGAGFSLQSSAINFHLCPIFCRFLSSFFPFKINVLKSSTNVSQKIWSLPKKENSTYLPP